LRSQIASQPTPTAIATSPRSSAASGTNARSATGTAPTAYRTSGVAGTSRLRSMAVTYARVPRRNERDATVRATPSGPARSASMVSRGSSAKTRLITNSTPTSAASEKAFRRKATRPKVPTRRPTDMYRAATSASARIWASGATSWVKADVGMTSARLAALMSRMTALPQPAAAPMR
jgi:hypothetical protein